MTNLGLFFWQICQKHISNREKGGQENPQAFLYPENKTIFPRYIRIRWAARAMEASSAANAVSLHDPSRENGFQKRPQAFLNPEI